MAEKYSLFSLLSTKVLQIHFVTLQDEHVGEKVDSLAVDGKTVSTAEAQLSAHTAQQLQQASKQTKRVGLSKRVETAAPLESLKYETDNQKLLQHEQKLKAVEQQVLPHSPHYIQNSFISNSKLTYIFSHLVRKLALPKDVISLKRYISKNIVLLET